MPLPISLAHRWPSAWPTCARTTSLDYLRPDGKTQVSVRYVDGQPVEIEKLLISTQHKEGAESLIPDDLWEHVVRAGPARGALRRGQAAPRVPRQPDRPLRHRRPRRRRGPDRPQDHRRHLRRHGPPRRRRVLGQGPVQGRPLGGLRGPLGRQERRGRRPGRPLRGAGRLRDRRRAPGLGHGRDVRHREDRPRRRSPSSSTSTSTCAPAPSARRSTCTARSTRRPPPTATSAARTRTSRGSAPTRPTPCATPPGWAPRPRSGAATAPRDVPRGPGDRRALGV